MCNTCGELRFFKVFPPQGLDMVGRVFLNGNDGYLTLDGIPGVFRLEKKESGEPWNIEALTSEETP